MKLTAFDTVGEPLYDERLRAIKKHIEEDDVTPREAEYLLQTWIHSLEHGMRDGKLDNAFAARRAINLLDTWRAEIERKAA